MVDFSNIKTFLQRIYKFSLVVIPAYILFLVFCDFYIIRSFPAPERYPIYEGILRNVKHLCGSFTAVGILAPIGIFTLLFNKTKGKRWLLLGFVTSFIVTIVAVGRIGDHGALLLPIYPIVAILCGYGMSYLKNNFRYSIFSIIFTTLLIISVSISVGIYVKPVVENRYNFRLICLEIDELRAPLSGVVGDLWSVQLYTWYTNESLSEPHVLVTSSGGPWISYHDLEKFVNRYNEIWILDINTKEWIVTTTQYSAIEVSLPSGITWVIKP
jgi:hypothetical protein